MLDGNDNNVASAVEAGALISDVDIKSIQRPTPEPGQEIGDPLVLKVVPAGSTLRIEDVEKYLPRPTRKRGVYSLGDAKSFIAFVNREKTAETFILANRENPGFTAIFNGNEAANLAPENGSRIIGDIGRPGWGDYKATYACPYSAEWKVWSAANGKKMTQHDFALFMEENAFDVVRPSVPGTEVPDNGWPDSDTMIRISRGLEAKKDVTFASALRLDSGQVQFKYEEEISGTVQGGFMDVPQMFAVGIPVFAGTAPWRIDAKLRWRIERGGLTMWFDFTRLFKITERSFDEARAEIAAGTSVPIFLGSKS